MKRHAIADSNGHRKSQSIFIFSDWHSKKKKKHTYKKQKNPKTQLHGEMDFPQKASVKTATRIIHWHWVIKIPDRYYLRC